MNSVKAIYSEWFTRGYHKSQSPIYQPTRSWKQAVTSKHDTFFIADNLQIEYTKINSNAKHESNTKGEKHHRRGKHVRKHTAPTKIQAPPKIHLLSDDDNVVEVVSYGGDSVWQKKEALVSGRVEFIQLYSPVCNGWASPIYLLQPPVTFLRWYFKWHACLSPISRRNSRFSN